MDYKELIEELRITAACGNDCYNCSRCIDAADAIETLLSELNALKTEWKWNYRQCNNEEK